MAAHLVIEASGNCSPATREFRLEHGRATIGRASDNDWVLDDPERVLSKTHCELRLDHRGLFVEDLSSNGVFINGAFSAIGREREEQLKDGDRLQLGEYVIRVELEAAGEADILGSFSGSVAADELTEVLAPPPEAVFGGDSFEPTPKASFDEVLPPADLNPLGLDELPKPKVSGRPAASDHLPYDAQFMPPPTPAAASGVTPPPATSFPQAPELLPEDWDVTGLLAGEAEPQIPMPADSNATLAEPPPFEPAPAAGEPDTGDATAAEPPTPIPPQPSIPPEAAVEPATVSPPARALQGQDDLFSIFLEHTGINLTGKQIDARTFARESGILFRKMLEGLMLLLQARMVVKNEYQLERTLLRPLANNPLKALPSVDEILGVMYRGDQSKGVWLGAEAAVDEAVQDLKSHDLALVAGMNAVVEHFVAALAPERFETDDGGRMKLLSISALEKAKSWDQFVHQYNNLARTLEGGLTGDARKVFERAYNREKERLDQ